MVEQIFFSVQVKWSLIIINKYGIYELLHELPNDLRLRILGNWKYQKNLEILSPPPLKKKMKIASTLAKNCWKIEIELFP